MFTLEDVKMEVIRLGTENPDFLYEKEKGQRFHSYRLGKNGGCIVGQSLSNLGVTDDTLQKMDTFGEFATAYEFLVSDGLLVGEIDETLDLIQEAQYAQDSELSWGDAIQRLTEAPSL